MKNTQYPSGGYSVLNGATTICERWNGFTSEDGFYNPSMNSFNHYSLGSCVYWMYAYVLGIKPQYGKVIKIAPKISSQLSYARGRYAFTGGEVWISWKWIDEKVALEVEQKGEYPLTFDFGEKEVIEQEKIGDVYRFILS